MRIRLDSPGSAALSSCPRWNRVSHEPDMSQCEDETIWRGACRQTIGESFLMLQGRGRSFLDRHAAPATTFPAFRSFAFRRFCAARLFQLKSWRRL